MRVQVFRDLAVIRIYHTSVLWENRWLWVEYRVLLRRQFLCLSARGGRHGSKAFVQDAEMLERYVRHEIGGTCHSGTYARSRFIRRMFFLANNNLKYSLSLSCSR